jgi:hypothetical protein
VLQRVRSPGSWGLHEKLDREDEVVGPSNLKFGLTIASVSVLLTVIKIIQGSPWWIFWGSLAATLIILVLFLPSALTGANKAWLRLGLVLSKLVHPVALALMFYLSVVPMGLLLRLFGKDLLRLKWDREARTYWIERTDPRPLHQSMRQQF